MSIRQNGKIIAGATQYRPDLFDWKWADHICNDVQWLRADTFSWQSGAVYQAAYQHLVADVQGKEYISETIEGHTVWYRLADDGHKIVTQASDYDGSSAVNYIYEATGVAWYYVLDETNQRFKLPRAKHRKLVGFNINYNNGTSISTNTNFTCPSDGLVFISHYGTDSTGTLTVNSTRFSYFQSVGAGSRGCVSLPVSKGTVVKYNLGSGVFYPEIKQEQDTDQYKYLYFYVGNFTQTALENTAGLNAELFNGKADVSTVAHVVTEFQEPTSANNYTWYRKYADGWVEQGGVINSATTHPTTTTQTCNLPIEMSDTNYTCVLKTNDRIASQTNALTEQYANSDFGAVGTKNTTSFQYRAYKPSWYVCGMAA